MVQVFELGLSILKDSLLEALTELAYRLHNSNCRRRPGIKSLLFGKRKFRLRPDCDADLAVPGDSQADGEEQAVTMK